MKVSKELIQGELFKSIEFGPLRGRAVRLHSPMDKHEARALVFTRKERMLLWSMYAWILTQNSALIAFLKYLEHKDKAWFEVSSSMMAALVYRISLFFSGIG